MRYPDRKAGVNYMIEQPNVVGKEVLELLNSITPDTFNKVVVAIVAVFVMLIQWWMAHRQLNIQEQIAKHQLETQEQIAKRQLETQEQIAKRQVETEERIATRQAADNVSAKRQAWIDDLRNDAAELLSLLSRLEELRRPPPGISAEVENKNSEECVAVDKRTNEVGMRVWLRLNPNEDDHNELLALLKALTSASGDPNPHETEADRIASINRFWDARKITIKHLQVILKKEWERVKTGAI